MLLIMLSQSEQEGRGGGCRDNVKEVGMIGRGMRAKREGDRDTAQH